MFTLAVGVLMMLTPAALGAEFSQDTNCSFDTLTARVGHMHTACCPGDASSCATALPSTCTVDCAAAFAPMYRDCVHAIDNSFDVGKATRFLKFEDQCSRISMASLMARAAAMQAMGCALDLSKVEATAVAAPSPPPAGCRDNDAVALRLVGRTCKQLRAKRMCGFLRLSSSLRATCACSCPASSTHSAPTSSRRLAASESDVAADRRNLFGHASKCATATIPARFSVVSQACCSKKDCADGVPSTCSLDCWKVLPPFLDDCQVRIERWHA